MGRFPVHASLCASAPLPSFAHLHVEAPARNSVYTAQETDFVLCYSFFKTLVDHEVTVELKNDISIRGTLKSVDQFLNIKLDDVSVVEELRYPHLVSAHPYTGGVELEERGVEIGDVE